MATTTETDAERRVREEQDGWEAENDTSPEPEEAEEEPTEPTDESGAPLFDPTDYDREDLALPKVDGEGIDKIGIAFSGTVFLDRADPNDVALMRAMRLGQDLTLNVEASCSSKATKFTTSREGELDAVVLVHGARVHTVYRPAGVGIGNDEAEPEAEAA